MTSKNDHSIKSDQRVDVIESLDEKGSQAYSLDRLSVAFENSARRWELIVYPSLFAFILLAAYGFYLIFSLAKDVHFLAQSVDTNMGLVSSNIVTMADSVSQLSANVRTMAVSVDSMARDMQTLEPMLTSMDSMEESMKAMTLSTHHMQRDMRVMNHSIYDASRPMAMWNNVMPW
ncbi:MAG: hypothetical protein PVF13_00810 [Chromatiales bacterium]|jgi:hypothetical protein